MRVAIFSAATRETRSGNWVTADRWRKLLTSAGHRVSIIHDYRDVVDCAADVLIGLHARRSARALTRFKTLHPDRSTIVVLTGTDIYRDLLPSRKRRFPSAIAALDGCCQIIMLQPLMATRLKRGWRSKSSVVMMDAAKVAIPAKRKVGKMLKACVVGHLRHEKDPLRAAMAVRKLPSKVSVEVTHAGGALSDSFQARADRESALNLNWHWLGSIPYGKVQRLMRSSDLLINSSRAEGAPNVLFEAIGSRLPILASKIDGHVGILGADYPGFFRVGDTKGLQEQLVRCATDESFYRSLVASMESLAKKYREGSELKALQAVVKCCR
ncbi:glycosyltransferase [Mariniblastus fucicola]|uniref:Glycosyl transferases group 1 n=1 Tax=Mariniblastus fucicola TaxID=980251 RepID=A0A5B9P5L1_9BACT|nr:glycosyltransferase [Mariniblastus fucicola]QEG20789.1 Glycosyl transferases group 1 [Mariniblastus fucicola]